MVKVQPTQQIKLRVTCYKVISLENSDMKIRLLLWFFFTNCETSSSQNRLQVLKLKYTGTSEQRRLGCLLAHLDFQICIWMVHLIVVGAVTSTNNFFVPPKVIHPKLCMLYPTYFDLKKYGGQGWLNTSDYWATQTKIGSWLGWSQVVFEFSFSCFTCSTPFLLFTNN